MLACLVTGMFVTTGFLFISGMVTYMSIVEAGMFNVVVAVIIFFSLMASITNHVLIKPSIESKYGEFMPSGRFLFFIIGMWVIAIPYIEVVSFKGYIVGVVTKFAFLVTRIF
jgi:hypothetical protein